MKNFGGMQQLMRQANQMQSKMKKLKEQLAAQEYNGTSGGEAVKVTVNGEYQLSKISIDSEVINADDKEMLEDMVLSATNEALKVAKETSEKEMSKITGGTDLPGF